MKLDKELFNMQCDLEDVLYSWKYSERVTLKTVNGDLYNVKTIFECFDELYKSYYNVRKTPPAHEVLICLKINLIEFISYALNVNLGQSQLLLESCDFLDDSCESWQELLFEVFDKYKTIQMFNELGGNNES